MLAITRLTFGLTPALQARVSAQGTTAFIEDQLSKTGPDPAVEARVRGRFVGATTRKQVYDNYYDNDGERRVDLTHSQVFRARYSDHQLFEMMCQLWIDHFNIHWTGDNNLEHLHLAFQEFVIRPNAMGTFRELLTATAEAPGMLGYLDNDRSRGDRGINENYGRELLELHTLGIKPDGSQIYTEEDVVAASQAMSGWWLSRRRQDADYSHFRFRDDYAYTGDITLLNGTWTRGATTGKATGDSLLEFLVTHRSTAENIAFKICRRFVSDQPSDALVQSAAQVYLANDTAIVPVLRHVFTSAEFAASGSQKFRRPLEAMVAMLRALGIELNEDPTDRSNNRFIRQSFLSGAGNEPGQWDMPDGFPDETVHWLTTEGMLQRWNLAARLARSREQGLAPDYASLRPAATTVGELITALGVQFGLGALPAESVQAVATAAQVDPADSAGVDERRLANIVSFLLAHPLFNVR